MQFIEAIKPLQTTESLPEGDPQFTVEFELRVNQGLYSGKKTK